MPRNVECDEATEQDGEEDVEDKGGRDVVLVTRRVRKKRFLSRSVEVGGELVVGACFGFGEEAGRQREIFGRRESATRVLWSIGSVGEDGMVAPGKVEREDGGREERAERICGVVVRRTMLWELLNCVGQSIKQSQLLGELSQKRRGR